MKKNILWIIFFVSIVNFSNSQNTRKEVVESEGVENNLTISNTDMYDSTDSKEAKEYYDIAYDYGMTKDFTNAEKYYLKAIQIDSSFVEAYDNLGRIYRVIESYPKAIEYYNKSIEIYPEGIMAHQNLAVVYGILKDYNSALKEYDILVQLEPSNAEGYFGRANSFMMLKKYDDALKEAENALTIYKSTDSEHLSDGYYLIGLIHYYNRNVEKAKKNLILAKKNGAKINPQLESQLKI